MRMRRIRWAAALALLLTLVCSAAMAATYITLKNGDTGDAVKQMQVALNALGYSTNGADGKFGSGTENAVRLFQKANGLKQDGKAGTQTLTLLYQQYDSLQNGGTSGSTGGSSSGGSTSGSSLFGGNYATLEYGSRGDRVKTLQTALNQLGYSAGSADGKFGAGTQKAVTAFQKANGLTADGKAGRITLQKIESLLGGASASTPTPQEVPSFRFTTSAWPAKLLVFTPSMSSPNWMFRSPVTRLSASICSSPCEVCRRCQLSSVRME